jgi:histidyl-tRNA synthetase
MGLERLLMAMPDEEPASHVDVFIVAAQPEVRAQATVLGRELRDAGLAVESDLRGGSLKSQLRRADKLDARIAMILGESEVERGVVQLKDLKRKTQDEVARTDAAGRVLAALSE